MRPIPIIAALLLYALPAWAQDAPQGAPADETPVEDASPGDDDDGDEGDEGEPADDVAADDEAATPPLPGPPSAPPPDLSRTERRRALKRELDNNRPTVGGGFEFPGLIVAPGVLGGRVRFRVRNAALKHVDIRVGLGAALSFPKIWPVYPHLIAFTGGELAFFGNSRVNLLLGGNIGGDLIPPLSLLIADALLGLVPEEYADLSLGVPDPALAAFGSVGVLFDPVGPFELRVMAHLGLMGEAIDLDALLQGNFVQRPAFGIMPEVNLGFVW